MTTHWTYRAVLKDGLSPQQIAEAVKQTKALPGVLKAEFHAANYNHHDNDIHVCTTDVEAIKKAHTVAGVKHIYFN